MTGESIFSAFGGLDPDLIIKGAPKEKTRKKRSHNLFKIITAAAILALAAIIIITALPMITRETEPKLPTEIDSIIWRYPGSIDSSMIIYDPWYDWHTDEALYNALHEASRYDYIAINVTKKLTDKYLYDGMTIPEISQKREYNEKRHSLLLELMKEGEILKYGEKLYTEGIPGVRWSKDTYDRTVERYGKEFLDEFIRGGVFYSNEAQAEMEIAEAEALRLARLYGKALEAYHASYLEEERDKFAAAGACAIVKNGRLFIFVTKAELANLKINNRNETYYLKLAYKRNYEHDPENTPVFENNVTGFALDRIQIKPIEYGGSYTPSSDSEVIDRLNAIIQNAQFYTDHITVSFSSMQNMTESDFENLNCRSVTIFEKRYSDSACLVWLYINFEDIDLEALRDLTNNPLIKDYITIYAESNYIQSY